MSVLPLGHVDERDEVSSPGAVEAIISELVSGAGSAVRIPSTMQAVESIVRWLERCLKRGTATIIAVVTPDWTVQDDGVLQLGPSMRRLLEALPHIVETFDENGLGLKLTVLLDDFEGERRIKRGAFTRDMLWARDLFLAGARVSLPRGTSLSLDRLSDYLGVRTLDDKSLAVGRAVLNRGNETVPRALMMTRPDYVAMTTCVRRMIGKDSDPNAFVRDNAPLAAVKLAMLGKKTEALIIAPDIFSAHFAQLTMPYRQVLPTVSVYKSQSRR